MRRTKLSQHRPNIAYQDMLIAQEALYKTMADYCETSVHFNLYCRSIQGLFDTTIDYNRSYKCKNGSNNIFQPISFNDIYHTSQDSMKTVIDYTGTNTLLFYVKINAFLKLRKALNKAYRTLIRAKSRSYQIYRLSTEPRDTTTAINDYLLIRHDLREYQQELLFYRAECKLQNLRDAKINERILNQGF